VGLSALTGSVCRALAVSRAVPQRSLTSLGRRGVGNTPAQSDLLFYARREVVGPGACHQQSCTRINFGNALLALDPHATKPQVYDVVQLTNSSVTTARLALGGHSSVGLK
jgi:hypothetical protein